MIRFEDDVVTDHGAPAIRMTNGEVELVIATSFGPRILGYSLCGGPNVFGFVDPGAQARPTPFGDSWHIYGGHRLWHAPEDPVRSYVPDNAPVRAEAAGASLLLVPPVERPTGLQKSMRLTLAESGSTVVVTHMIQNVGDEEVELAVWCLSLMAKGGVALLPNPSFAPHPQALLPARRIVTWPYTSLADPRFRLGPRFLRIAQQPGAASPQKLGVSDGERGWAAYALGTQLFVKRFTPQGDPQVDLGCNVEVFTDGDILELETLGPLQRLRPGAVAFRVETWCLLDGVEVSDDDDIAAAQLESLLDGDGLAWPLQSRAS